MTAASGTPVQRSRAALSCSALVLQRGQVDCVVTLDVGSSSARTLLFALDGRQIEGFGSQVPYSARTTADGGWEIDADELTSIARRALGDICGQMRGKSVQPVAVAVDTFWHSLVGVDADGKPTTALLQPVRYAQRAGAARKELAARVDNAAQHRRTGCVIHPSYPPAKLLWLRGNAAGGVPGKASRWMQSAGEYLFPQIFGKAAASTGLDGFGDRALGSERKRLRRRDVRRVAGFARAVRRG